MPVASIPGIELGAELGRGSHSMVLRGSRDGREYAVKLPREAASGAERDAAYRRFLREAIALARARDSSLPEVMEIGRTKAVPYLVMELAPGETLAERLERGPLGDADVLGLSRQLAGALVAIHSAGLVHRDVKPQNIVFDAQTGVAKLVDLGSAALLHGAVGLVGTPAYAAPELLSGAPRAADVRTDLYSLGRVLAECLEGTGAGRAPVRPAGTATASRDASELSRIIARLTALDPSARPASAAKLRSEIDELVSVDPREEPKVRLRETPAVLGRDVEVDELRRAWARIRRASPVVFLQGAAGAGKTRLANAFVTDVAGADANVMTAACHPRDPRAFSAVRQLVDGYLRKCEQLPPAERADALAEIRKLGGEHGALLKLLSPTVARVFRDAPNIPASANAEQAFSEGLSEFLGKLVRRASPALVFVDDVQWLDPSSRRVLARAVVQAPKRAMFLYSARTGDASEDVKRFSDLFIAKPVTVELRPLGGDDLLEIARRFLSSSDLASEVEHTLLRLADGTPLSVLELLRTLVEEGVLLPHWGRWQLDAKALSAMDLPRETASLLARRIGALDVSTRSVLSAGATIGMAFDDRLVSAASAADEQITAAALAEARRAELVEDEGAGAHRFIHHTIRDALLAGLDPTAAELIHSRVAAALSERGASEQDAPDADHLYRLAYHHGAGGSRCPADLVSATNIAAGEAAVIRFDNERAIEFFETAERALLRASTSLEPETRLLLGEARLRSGALDGALAEFASVLSSAHDPLIRAGALVRVATIHEMRFDSKRAWEALDGAFRALGEELPKETAANAVLSATSWVRRSVRAKNGVADSASSRARDELLCALYYQTGRIAFTSGKPGRLILSTLRALEPAERLGPSAALAKSYLAYAFFLTVLGFPKAGRGYFAEAQRTAQQLRDPVAYSHTLQMELVIAAWDGRMADAVEAGTRCLLNYGNWRELNEFCFVAWSLFQIETIRGRDIEAWRWLDLPIQRVNRHPGEPVVHEFLILAARGALLALGREDEARLLLRRLQQATALVPKDSDTYVWTFGPRVRLFTEDADFDAEFEELNRNFAALGQDPKQAHLIAFEYYLHVAHARVHACLRANDTERSAMLPALELARADLEAAARKIPLFRAHAITVRAYQHLFQGRREKAFEGFAEAEAIGVTENAPWVLYAVHRGRAHALKANGFEAAAVDQAVLAESIAREHGSVHRAKWVREEFGLTVHRALELSDYTPTHSADRTYLSDATGQLSGGSRARRQLRALLRISQARAHELEPDLQARLVVDELVQALRAERGFLFLTSAVGRVDDRGRGARDPSALEMVVGREVSGRDIASAAGVDRATVQGASEISSEPGAEVSASFCLGTTSQRSAVAAPLVVDDVTVGVVYVDRALADGVFTETDGEVLAALAGQVAMALELTRALRARERAEENLRSAEKMDAVARLARGIGHDVNNMLSAVGLTTEAIAQTPGAQELVGDDIRAIQSVVQGAGELTRRLRDIAHDDFGHPEVLRLAQRVGRMTPMITGLLGPGIRLQTRLEGGGFVFLDPSHLDQIVTNLAINARDAMQDGGDLTIEVQEVTLDDAYMSEHPRVTRGSYLRLSVLDTGHGMEADVRNKIFEPYFTTKRDRGGTGIGLSSVYWIVSRSGGHIDVESTPGSGTKFSLYFPAGEASSSTGTAVSTGELSLRHVRDEASEPAE